VGTVAQAIDRMNAYAAVGVQRFVLNHELFDDLDQIELLAEEILPRVVCSATHPQTPVAQPVPGER